MRTKLLLGCLSLLTLLFAACGPENKSVTEPLTPEEAQKLAKKYENFLTIYENQIYHEVNKYPENSLTKQRLRKLTYGDFMDFYTKIFDTEWVAQTEKRIDAEWEEKYDMKKLTPRLNAMADSIITAWEKYEKESDPSTYASVELVDIKKSAYVVLKITPLKGDIDKIKISYRLFHTKEELPYRVNDQMGGGEVIVEKPISQPIVVENEMTLSIGYPGLNPSYYDYFYNTPIEKIKQSCKLDASVTEVKKNGETINWLTISDKKPYCVYDYKEFVKKGDTSSSEYMRERDSFIHDYIDRNYEKKSSYHSTQIMKVQYELNPLAFLLYYGESFTNVSLELWGMEPLN